MRSLEIRRLRMVSLSAQAERTGQDELELTDTASIVANRVLNM